MVTSEPNTLAYATVTAPAGAPGAALHHTCATSCPLAPSSPPTTADARTVLPISAFQSSVVK